MENKVIEKRFATIVESVCYWLGYQLKIGRAHLIHEASLRYPIADAITSGDISINRIVLEQLHPTFKGKKIDIAIYNESVEKPVAKKADTLLDEVFELKLAKSKTAEEYSDEHQRIFDDVVRLAYYNMWCDKDCYFLMCGTYENFKTYFVEQIKKVKQEGNQNVVASKKNKQTDVSMAPKTDEWNPEGLYKDWFEFKLGESKTITFDNTNEEWGLTPFQKNYEPRPSTNTFNSTITVKTTCIAISPAGEKNKTHAAGLWKIEGVS